MIDNERSGESANRRYVETTDHATRGYVHRIFGGGLALIILASTLLSFQGAKGQVDAQRAACERGNTARQSELRQRQNLLQNAKSRAQSPDPDTAAEGKEALRRARARKQELIASQEEVAVEPGSVLVDCATAFPHPWPLN